MSDANFPFNFGGRGREQAARMFGAMAQRGRGGHRGEHPGHHAHHGRRGGGGPWGFGPGGPGGPGPWGFGPGFPFGGPGRRSRRSGRAGRGDIRLAVLALLAEAPMHGYQLMREIAGRTDGIWRPSPGAVYPALQQLEDEDLVTADKAEGKRVFRLTEQGTGYVEEHRAEIDGVWDSVNEDVDESWLELAQLGKGVVEAFMQVTQAGDRKQVAAARDIMAETRRRLYRILAEEPSTGTTDDTEADPED